MKYSKQKNADHYLEKYDNLERFISYFNQKELILKFLKTLPEKYNSSILEIGKGNGFLSDYLKKQEVDIKTFDIAEDLKPDYVGDLMDINKIIKNNFDIVVCFETLEHMKFEDAIRAIEYISKITKKYFILSVPQISLYLSLCIKIPVFKSKKIFINVPFPVKHRFDGEHFWELGKFGFSQRNFKKILNKYFIIKSDYTDPLNHYHHYFILEKR